MLFLFWIFLVAFILIQQLCSSSLSFSLVAALNGIRLNLQILFSLFTPQLHTESLIFIWLLTKGILMCLGLYWHGYSCWSKYSLRTIICSEENCLRLCCRQECNLSWIFSCRTFPRAQFCWKGWRRCLGNNNHTHPDAVGKSKIFLEYWNIFRRPGWISALWEFLKMALVPSSWTCKLSFD